MRIKLCDSSRLCFVFCLLSFVLYVSCSNSPGNLTTDAGEKSYKDTIQRKPPSSFSDTITIDFPAAVFYTADSLQLEKLKLITDTMVYESAVHENFYLMKNSRLVLKKHYPHIKIIEVKKARYLLFKMAGGEKEYIDLNAKNDSWGIFIFDGKKASRPVDMANIDTELGFYFTK